MNDEIAGVDTLALPPLTRPVLQLLLLLSSEHFIIIFSSEGRIILDFFMYFIKQLLICRLSASIMSQDVGIDPERLRIWHW